ncbi:MAG: RNA polymerase sigma factor [Myxococcales bacterium]|nr:RNA polymerase sigma factor [Myxococcales bacterium]MDH3484074.1 RNA polymerase sigma factor [Myxococcales bacterium]
MRPDLWSEHRSAVRAFLTRMLGDATLAEDLTQVTFLKAHTGRASFRGDASEKTWLISIAMNVAKDHLRKGTRAPDETGGEVERFASAVDTEDELLRDEMSACVAEFVFRLPPPQRNVIALHDMAGLKHKEIAAQLDISESNSRVLLHRGRAALKASLREGCVLSLEEDTVPCDRKQQGDSCKPEGRDDESFDSVRAPKP